MITEGEMDGWSALNFESKLRLVFQRLQLNGPATLLMLPRTGIPLATEGAKRSSHSVPRLLRVPVLSPSACVPSPRRFARCTISSITNFALSASLFQHFQRRTPSPISWRPIRVHLGSQFEALQQSRCDLPFFLRAPAPGRPAEGGRRLFMASLERGTQMGPSP